MDGMSLLLVVAVLFFVVMMVFTQMQAKRTITNVLRMFRQHNALNAKNAKTVDELGVKSRTTLQKLFKPRDYRPTVIREMVKHGVILETEEGKLYLSEERLAATKWGRTGSIL